MLASPRRIESNWMNKNGHRQKWNSCLCAMNSILPYTNHECNAQCDILNEITDWNIQFYSLDSNLSVRKIKANIALRMWHIYILRILLVVHIRLLLLLLFDESWIIIRMWLFLKVPIEHITTFHCHHFDWPIKPDFINAKWDEVTSLDSRRFSNF